MKESSIPKIGTESFGPTGKPKPEPDIDKLMEEVGGVIDQQIGLAFREALEQHARDGVKIPVWENEKVVWRPAVEVLAEVRAMEAANAKANAPGKRKTLRKTSRTSVPRRSKVSAARS